MSSSHRVLKNTGILMGMELGTRLMDAVVSILLARYLGPADFGLMAFAVSFASLFSILPGFGMGSLATRDVAQHPDRISRYVSNGLGAKVFLAGFTYTVLAVTAHVMGFPAEKWGAVMLAGVLMITETNVRYLVSFFQGTQRMGTVATVNLSIRAGWIAGSILVMLLGGNVTHLLAVRVAVVGAGLLTSLWFIHTRLQRITWKFEPRFMFQLVKTSIPFAMFRLRGALYMDIDTVMVSAMRGDIVCGWYAAAQKSLRVLSFIPSSFSNSLLPAMSHARQEKGPQAVAEVLGRNCRYLAVLGFAVAGGIFTISDWMVPAFYGEAFRPAAWAQQVLIWAVPFAFLNGSLLAATAAVNRETRGSWILVGGALFSSLSNFIVVPLWGHVGAAATTTLAEIVICHLQLRLVQGVVPGFTMLQGRGWGLGLALAGMLGSGFLLRGFPAAVRLPVALGLYAGIIHLTSVLSEEDRETLGKLFRRRKGGGEPGKPSLPADLTVHCRVRNEERFVRKAIESVLPLAKKVLVYDTGSTDRTLEEVAAIQSDKIEIVRRPPSDPKGIMEYRNEMIDRTTTEWFMLVDGDEIYPARAVRKIAKELAAVPTSVHRIVLHRKHFIGSFNFVSGVNRVGRIFRTREVRHKIYSPKYEDRVGHETPYLRSKPEAPVASFSMRFPPEIFFFHCHHLRRSSRDEELGRMRRWRKVPLPVVPYVGPWPETLSVNGASRRVSLRVIAQCLRINVCGLLRVPVGEREAKAA